MGKLSIWENPNYRITVRQILLFKFQFTIPLNTWKSKAVFQADLMK